MDKIIEQKKGWRSAFTKNAWPWWAGGLLLIVMVSFIAMPHHSTQRIGDELLTISEVKHGEFNDYIRLSGSVQPMVTVQLSPIEGGMVEEIMIEEGANVKAGDAILRLKNDALDLQILNSEAELAEKENLLRNTQIQMEQDRLNMRQQKAELQTEVSRLKRAYDQQKQLFDEKLISRNDYLKAKEDYDLAKEKLKLVIEKSVQDSLYRSTQVERMRESLENMHVNMQMIRRRKDNLTIKAPIDGQIGLLDAVLGENITEGTKIGQISDMGSYKIVAQIDEHYIDKVTPGLDATIDRNDANYQVSLRKVYPEVHDAKFKADFKFSGEVPENIRSGQTYYLNLLLGQPADAIIIPRGTFYQKTGGNWIYVVSSDGTRAEKRQIRIGRQNPQYYEVLEGLSAGEMVITSSYDNFGDNDVLIINK